MLASIENVDKEVCWLYCCDPVLSLYTGNGASGVVESIYCTRGEGPSRSSRTEMRMQAQDGLGCGTIDLPSVEDLQAAAVEVRSLASRCSMQ